MAKKASPASTYGKDMLLAFLFGGAICTLGQCILDLYRALGLDEKSAGAFVSITLIGLSALLTALRIYDNLAKYGGAGTLVPITGFANSIVAPAMEFKSEGFVLGIGAKDVRHRRAGARLQYRGVDPLRADPVVFPFVLIGEGEKLCPQESADTRSSFRRIPRCSALPPWLGKKKAKARTANTTTSATPTRRSAKQAGKKRKAVCKTRRCISR